MSIRKPSLILLAAAAVLVSGCATLDRPGGGGTVDVQFQDPDRFTDMTRNHPRGGADDGYLDEVREYLQRTGASRLPAGYTLAVTITDVDMAGEFEPQRGPDFNDVRVVKQIYAPRITLTYRLTGPDGAVRDEGQRTLHDPTFDWRVQPINRNDPLYHEKELLDSFLSEIAKGA